LSEAIQIEMLADLLPTKSSSFIHFGLNRSIAVEFYVLCQTTKTAKILFHKNKRKVNISQEAYVRLVCKYFLISGANNWVSFGCYFRLELKKEFGRKTFSLFILCIRLLLHQHFQNVLNLMST
jgi:hypothetical protein